MVVVAVMVVVVVVLVVVVVVVVVVVGVMHNPNTSETCLECTSKTWTKGVWVIRSWQGMLQSSTSTLFAPPTTSFTFGGSTRYFGMSVHPLPATIDHQEYYICPPSQEVWQQKPLKNDGTGRCFSDDPFLIFRFLVTFQGLLLLNLGGI